MYKKVLNLKVLLVTQKMTVTLSTSHCDNLTYKCVCLCFLLLFNSDYIQLVMMANKA